MGMVAPLMEVTAYEKLIPGRSRPGSDDVQHKRIRGDSMRTKRGAPYDETPTRIKCAKMLNLIDL
jgi:hypothetical protein